MSRNAIKPTVDDESLEWAYDDDTVSATVRHPDFPHQVMNLTVTLDGLLLAFAIASEVGVAGAITVRSLRRVPMASLTDAVRLRAAELFDLEEFGVHTSPALSAELDAKLGREAHARKREPRSDLELADVARRLSEACARGDARRALAEVGEQLGYAPTTVRSLRDEARRRGFYETRGRGRPGGTITAKAVQVLEAGGDR